MGGQKVFKAKLLLNYKTGEIRLFKRDISAHSVWEIPVALNVTVEVPDYETQKIEGTVILKKAKVADMTLESL